MKDNLTKGERAVMNSLKEYILEYNKPPFKKELYRLTPHTESYFYTIMTQLKRKGVVKEEKVGAKTYVELI